MPKKLMTKGNTTADCGEKVKSPPVEKLAMSSFCPKPHALKVPNKALKRRSREKFHVAIGDEDGVLTFGTRSNSFAFGDENATYPDCRPKYVSSMNDASDLDNHPNPCKNKSKTTGASIPLGHLSTLPSYNQRPGKGYAMQRVDMEFSDWPNGPNQKHQQSEVHSRLGNVQLGVQDPDEFSVHHALDATKNASKLSKLKRENAQRLFCKANIAYNMAASALWLLMRQKPPIARVIDE